MRIGAQSRHPRLPVQRLALGIVGNQLHLHSAGLRARRGILLVRRRSMDGEIRPIPRERTRKMRIASDRSLRRAGLWIDRLNAHLIHKLRRSRRAVPHQRRQRAASAIGIEPTLRHQGTLHPPGVNRFGDPFQLLFAKIGQVKDAGHQSTGGGGDDNLIGNGQSLQARS